MPKELLLVGDHKIKFEDYTELPLAADQVRAKAVLSAISHGTEINLYRGTSAFHRKRFDTEKRLFIADDQNPSYPMQLGYEWVGRVTDVGMAVSGFKQNDLVHLPLPHRETHTFIPEEYIKLEDIKPLPDTVIPEQAIFISSVSIALQAIQDAHIKVGDYICIFGMGALGLLAVQLANINGASHIDVFDPIQHRRELAVTYGATRSFDPIEVDPGTIVKSDNSGADVAIEFSGNYSALHDAVRCVRMGGLVVAAGFYQGGAAALNLGEEWLHNQISMVASTRSWGNVHRDYPMWNRVRLRETSIKLLSEDRIKTDQLISHHIPFLQADQAYRLIDQGDRDVLKIVFDYNEY